MFWNVINNMFIIFLMLFCFFSLLFYVEKTKEKHVNENIYLLADENETESETSQFSESDGTQEVVDGSVNQFEFTSVTYIGFALIFLILVFFLSWKFISSRRRVRAGQMDDNINNGNEKGKKKRRRNKRDIIQIEVEEDSDESKGSDTEPMDKPQEKKENSDAEVVITI